jgi:endo-1,4-beta-xylanase
VYAKHSDSISSITFWGLDDSQSWLNNFPVRGRTNHPLLFDRQLLPKSAYTSVVSQAER